jgi:hypothetical protein
LKVAGIARTLALAALGLLLFVAPAGAATKGVAPLRASIANDFNSAIDGTDIFWTEQRKSVPEPKNGYTYTDVLMRTSFLDGKKSVVKRFDPNDVRLGFPEKLLAGGGYVYANMHGDGPEELLDSGTNVVRMAHDGSNLQTVATGQMKSSEEDDIVVVHGKGQLNDCGTKVEAESVTDDGSVLIRETTSDRESAMCGRKKNVDHDRIYLLSPAGVSREIIREDLRISLKFKSHSDGGWDATTGAEGAGVYVVDIVGDRAIITRNGGKSYYVRDVNTGADTGPYKTGIVGYSPFNLASIDSIGRVALSAYGVTGTRKHLKQHHAAGVYVRPGDTTSFVRAKGLAFLNFCGNHLISLTRRGARELDPVTLNLIRPIAPVHKDGSVVDLDTACSNDFLYMKTWGGKGAKYLAYPLK